MHQNSGTLLITWRKGIQGWYGHNPDSESEPHQAVVALKTGRAFPTFLCLYWSQCLIKEEMKYEEWTPNYMFFKSRKKQGKNKNLTSNYIFVWVFFFLNIFFKSSIISHIHKGLCKFFSSSTVISDICTKLRFYCNV